jgi:hypothetical protein
MLAASSPCGMCTILTVLPLTKRLLYSWTGIDWHPHSTQQAAEEHSTRTGGHLLKDSRDSSCQHHG